MVNLYAHGDMFLFFVVLNKLPCFRGKMCSKERSRTCFIEKVNLGNKEPLLHQLSRVSNLSIKKD